MKHRFTRHAAGLLGALFLLSAALLCGTGVTVLVMVLKQLVERIGGKP